MFNKNNIIKSLKLYGVVISAFITIFSVYKYSQLIGFTKIKKIHISGNNFIEKSTIKDHLKLGYDADLLFFDISENQQLLTEIDYIKSCRISRIFPSTLIVEIIENDPIAHLKTLENEFIMDKDGILLPLNLSIISYFSLPELKLSNSININNYESNDFTKNIGSKLNELQFQYPQIFNGILEFQFSEKEDIIMDFAQNTKIYVKKNDLDLHFKILDEFQEIKQNLSNYSIIDLRVKDQLIVKENRI